MGYIRYARKSSEEEEKQVQSIPDQTTVLSRLASELALDVSYELEEAKSAKKPGNRPIFDYMVKLIRQGKADRILCWHVNRLFRNPTDYGTIAQLMLDGKLKSIRTIDREYLATDNVIILAVEAGLATQFSIELSQNVGRGLHEKARRGTWPSKARPGYINVTEMIDGIRHRSVQPDPNCFPLMKRAMELMLTGIYSVPEIHAYLQAWGYRSPKTKKMGGTCISLPTLYECFKCPFYYGWFSYAGQFIQGDHQPMITKAEFDKIQQILRRDKESNPNPQKRFFAFTGLIRCSRCGCQVTAERKVKHYPTTSHIREYVYYHCTNARHYCSKVSMTEPKIEENLRERLARCRLDQLDTEWANWVKQALEKLAQTRPRSIATFLKLHTKNLTECRKKLQRLYDMRLANEVSADEFVIQKNRLQEEIIKLEEAIGRLKGRENQQQETIRNLKDFSEAAYDRFTAGSIKAKRLVALTLGNDYIFSDGRLNYKMHPLLAPIVKIEPPKRPFQQVKNDKNAPEFLALCSSIDEVRNLLNNSDISFPKLSLLDEV